jgi:hypothetical protein
MESPLRHHFCTEYVVSAKMELVTDRLDRSPNWNPIPAERTLPACPRLPGPFQGWPLQSASLGGGTLRVPAASGPAHRAGTGQPRRAGCCSASKVAEGQAWGRRRGKWEISARQIIISQVRNRSRPSGEGERAVPWYEGEDLWGACPGTPTEILYCTVLTSVEETAAAVLPSHSVLLQYSCFCCECVLV